VTPASVGLLDRQPGGHPVLDAVPVEPQVLDGDDVTRLATAVQELGQEAVDMLERACLEAPANLA
jgi:hypothetical protein